MPAVTVDLLFTSRPTLFSFYLECNAATSVAVGCKSSVNSLAKRIVSEWSTADDNVRV